ncbi:AsmA family protein [Falsihalocynthiibacter sp. SS001]|uniref:AsmA family protein n=1 Tax=Falsihalocynthiibacter sp. SS001 TaxID=3349698 RepID=UPI0036D390D8
MRWIFRAFKLLLALSLLSVLAIALIPSKRLANAVISELEAVLGRTVTISGDVTTSVFPRPKLTTGPVTIANAKWGEAPKILSAEGVDIHIDWMPLLRGDLVVRNLEFLAPKIHLETNKEGTHNWELTPKVSTDRSVLIRAVSSSGGVLRYIDSRDGDSETLKEFDARISVTERGMPAKVAFSALRDGVLFETNTTLAQPRAFLSGRVSDVKTKTIYANTTLEFDGRLGIAAREFDGEMSLRTDSASDIFRGLSINISPPNERLQLAGRVTRTAAGETYLRGGEIRVGGQSLTGDFDITTGPDRPMIKGVFAARNLSLNALNLPLNEQGSTASGEWSDQPLSMRRLFAIDADISLSAESLEVGSLHFGPSQLRLNLNTGRAVLELLKLSAYGGEVVGNVVVNGRGNGSVGADVDFENVNIRPFMGTSMVKTSGMATGDMQLLGLGDTMKEIVNSLSGEGNLTLNDATISGANWWNMLNQRSASSAGNTQQTAIDFAQGAMRMEAGNVRLEDFALRGDGGEMRVTGDVRLGPKALDIGVSALADPAMRLNMSGSWSAPVYSIEAASVARTE